MNLHFPHSISFPPSVRPRGEATDADDASGVVFVVVFGVGGEEIYVRERAEQMRLIITRSRSPSVAAKLMAQKEGQQRQNNNLRREIEARSLRPPLKR